MIGMCAWSAGGECGEPATMLVRVEGVGADDSGIMIMVMWSHIERVKGPRPMYCLDHARHILSGVPTLAPPLSANDSAGEVFTHG